MFCVNELKYYKNTKCPPTVNLNDKYILSVLFNNFVCYLSIEQTVKQACLEAGGCGFLSSCSNIFYSMYLQISRCCVLRVWMFSWTAAWENSWTTMWSLTLHLRSWSYLSSFISIKTMCSWTRNQRVTLLFQPSQVCFTKLVNYPFSPVSAFNFVLLVFFIIITSGCRTCGIILQTMQESLHFSLTTD